MAGSGLSIHRHIAEVRPVDNSGGNSYYYTEWLRYVALQLHYNYITLRYVTLRYVTYI